MSEIRHFSLISATRRSLETDFHKIRLQFSTKFNQNVMVWSLVYSQLFHKLKLKSVQYFLRYPGDGQTNKQTNRGKSITSWRR